VSELFLPPLSDTDDRGGLVAVVWDHVGAGTGVKNNNNGIFEIFVDSQDTVHESWLIHSANINSNLVCANLHASIMASCGREITNIAQYNFVNTEFASATFKKIVILPKKQPPQNEYDPDKRPVVYTILGLLQIFVEYTSLAEDDAPTTLCQVDLELTWVQRRQHRTSDRENVCRVHHPLHDAANAENVTIFSLLSDRILDQREIVLSSSPRDTLLLMTTQKGQESQKIQTLAAFVNSSSGLARLMFRVVHRDRIALDQGFVASNQHRLVEYSEYQDDPIATYTGIILHDAACSRDNRDQEDNLIVYTIKQSNLAMTSNIENFIKEYVVTLPDRGEMQEYKARENGITATLDADQDTISFGMRAGSGFGKTTKVTVAEVCDYMNCKACSTRRLKAACNAAQKCALVNCVGTVINPNNVLCVAGSLVKEIHEVYLTNVDVMWFSLVETTMSMLHLSKVSGAKNVIYLESVSNIVNSALCETKDIYAGLSAIFPSLVFSIYVAAVGKKQQSSILDIQTPASSNVRQTFSPGAQLQNVAIVSSITQVIYQVSLIHLHIMHASSKLMLCTIDKFAEFSGGYVDVVNHDTELGKQNGPLDFCTSQPSISEGVTALNDLAIINNRVAIGAVDNNIVSVDIAGRRISTGTFTLDLDKAIIWATRYQYITWLIWSNAAFDSVLGILYGISRILGIVENEECRPRPVEFSSILKCVCGDVAYTIDRVHRTEVASGGALWCTGLLKMINAEGNIVYIENPYSLQELSSDLHDAGQKYIDCITAHSENHCLQERMRVFLPKYDAYFSEYQVSPLAVLARCRENFNSKTWDEGVFGLYNTALRDDIVVKQRGFRKKDMQRIRTAVDTYLREDDNGIIHACLAAGPLQNRIQACMGLTFTYHNQLQQDEVNARGVGAQGPLPDDFSTQGYFVYDIAKKDDPPDACEYLSSPSFLANADVRRCRSDDADNGDSGNACGFSMSSSAREDTCRIGQSTLAYEQSIQTNIIDEFRISNQVHYDAPKIAAVEANVQQQFGAVSVCTRDYAVAVDQQIMPNIRRIVNALDLTLITGEGDLLHQFVDCIFMGAQTNAILAPADTAGVLENLMYSRHVNGTSREFELPCAGTLVYDSEDVDPDKKPFMQQTCGSDTRIAVMAYVTRAIVDVDGGGLHALVASLISEKITSITSKLTDVQNYGCLGKVTGLVWKNVGATLPSSGRMLQNTALSAIMLSANAIIVTMTAMQWNNVGIVDILKDDHIKAGNSYFQPNLDVSWKYCCAEPGHCRPGESDFESNLPDVDTTISVDSIFSALTDNIKQIERDAITKPTVRALFPTARIVQFVRDAYTHTHLLSLSLTHTHTHIRACALQTHAHSNLFHAMYIIEQFDLFES